MVIRIATFVITFAVALIAIVVDTTNVQIKIALAGLAVASLVLAIFIEVQASQDARFTKRALERLIQSSTPSDLFASAVQQIILKEASRRGLGSALVRRAQGDRGYDVDVIFTDESQRNVETVFHYDHEQLARWSLLDPEPLDRAIVATMFTQGPLPTVDLMEHWNGLVDFIGTVAKALYPDSVYGGDYAMSADMDAVEIGVPYPQSGPPAAPGRTKELAMGHTLVPFLIFRKQELATLAGQGNLDAARSVSTWLHDAWGPATVIG